MPEVRAGRDSQISEASDICESRPTLDKAAPGAKQDQQLHEPQDDKQGAPAAAWIREDGSDSSDDSTNDRNQWTGGGDPLDPE
ncbi:hypothetical protein ACU4HD_44620 (plasmid) [Cupriavidus basilensis]